MPSLFVVATLVFGLLTAALPLRAQSATSRTAPPPGAVVVRAGTDPASEEFARVQAAVDSLPDDNSNQTIFIFPGMSLRRTMLPGFHVTFSQVTTLNRL